MSKKPKKHNGWPNPSDVSKEQLVDIIMEIQGILWADERGKPDRDKEWVGCEIEAVSELLIKKGLAP